MLLSGDQIAIEIGQWPAGADDRRHELMTEQRAESTVPARFLWKQVRPPVVGGRTDDITGSAVNRDSFKVRDCFVEIFLRLLYFRGVRSEDVYKIGIHIFKLNVCCRNRADIAAGTRVRHPRSRCVLARCIDHVKRRIVHGVDDVCPVREGLAKPSKNLLPGGVKKPKLLATAWPWRSG